MVISKQFETVWQVSSNVGEGLGVASIIVGVAKEIDRMQRVWSSKTLSINEKGPMLLFIGSAAMLRGVTNVVPEAVHLLALSATGYLDIASLAAGNRALQWADALKSGDQWVSSTFAQQWDGMNWYTFVSQHLTM